LPVEATEKYTDPCDSYAKPPSSAAPISDRISEIADVARGSEYTGSRFNSPISASKRAISSAARSK